MAPRIPSGKWRSGDAMRDEGGADDQTHGGPCQGRLRMLADISHIVHRSYAGGPKPRCTCPVSYVVQILDEATRREEQRQAMQREYACRKKDALPSQCYPLFPRQEEA